MLLLKKIETLKSAYQTFFLKKKKNTLIATFSWASKWSFFDCSLHKSLQFKLTFNKTIWKGEVTTDFCTVHLRLSKLKTRWGNMNMSWTSSFFFNRTWHHWTRTWIGQSLIGMHRTSAHHHLHSPNCASSLPPGRLFFGTRWICAATWSYPSPAETHWLLHPS